MATMVAAEAAPMETLACMSPQACPSCWHYRANQCGLLVQLRTALAPGSPAMGPLARLVSA